MHHRTILMTRRAARQRYRIDLRLPPRYHRARFPTRGDTHETGSTFAPAGAAGSRCRRSTLIPRRHRGRRPAVPRELRPVPRPGRRPGARYRSRPRAVPPDLFGKRAGQDHSEWHRRDRHAAATICRIFKPKSYWRTCDPSPLAGRAVTGNGDAGTRQSASSRAREIARAATA